MINQISTSNTFAQWLVATQQLIDKYNYIEDTANTFVIFVDDTKTELNLVVDQAESDMYNTYINTVSVLFTTEAVYNNTVGVYNATESIRLQAISDTGNVYSNTVNVYNNTVSVYNQSVLATGNIYSNTVNVYNNTVTVYTDIQSYVGSAYNTANAVFDAANNASSTANLALTTANAAINVANTIFANIFSIVDETTSNVPFYPIFSDIYVGVPQDVYVSSTKLYYYPATGQLNSTNFNSLSDENKKTDIVTITNALDFVKELRGVYFTWKDTGQKSLGLIAQELESVIPCLVDTNLNGEKSVSYGNIVGLLIEAIKEQQKQIDELRNLINK